MESHQVTALLDAVPWPAILIERSEQIAAANALALALFGGTMVGRHYILTLRNPELSESIRTALESGKRMQARFSVAGPSRETIYRVNINPVANGGPTGVLCVFEDITEIEYITLMRREFVANVSHELRTPLTALLGFIETLRGAARDDAAARSRFLGIMAKEAERMNRLVRDLLSLSRVEAEERVRPKQQVDLHALIQSVVATFRPMANAAGVTIEITGEDGPLATSADLDQLTQVFGNLIENAMKYGQPGGPVTVELARIAHDPSLRAPAASISVTDRGEGIDPVHLPRLTERFYRVDTHRSRENGGTGLGLAIVKHIVNRHRGRLRIESEPGQGSCFTVILPLE